jgi:menaquinone-9 beta-reductase
VIIKGGGLAGCAAAMAARRLGAPVTLVEKSVFPRHKVCGEFLSPEVLPILAGLGLERAFLDLAPAPMRRVVLNFGRSEKRFALPEAAYGLSRFALDHFLLESSKSLGAEVVRESAGRPDIVAVGRGALPSANGAKGKRLFGFKAHFAGPVNDAVELYFFPGGYVGVNPVEGGLTNVCGLGPEDLLRKLDFSVDALISRVPALQTRVSPLKRAWDWLFVGPLVFENRLNTSLDAYYAGDALSFVDPFTGSGMLSALHSGALAGGLLAQGASAEEYQRQAAQALSRPFAVSSFLRKAVWNGWATRLAPLAPGKVMFWMTRPKKFAQK